MIETLSLNDLTLNYGSQKVCESITCNFNRGRVNLVVGRAGSGKSTLLKTIAGFHRDCYGEILADQNPFDPEGNIALAFQNPENLFFNPTVGEEVCFALHQSGNTENIQKTGQDWLERWGLSPEKFWNKHPIELSGGEKRKVALAACTVLLPDVILLDEPLAGLDFSGRNSLVRIIKEISSNHIVIIVTHDPENLFDLAGSVLFIADSHVKSYITAEFVIRALKDPDFYPLPEWYSENLQFKDPPEKPPVFKPESVYRYLKGVARNDDYIFSG